MALPTPADGNAAATPWTSVRSARSAAPLAFSPTVAPGELLRITPLAIVILWLFAADCDRPVFSAPQPLRCRTPELRQRPAIHLWSRGPNAGHAGWYERAAEAGSTGAMFDLGILFAQQERAGRGLQVVRAGRGGRRHR